MCICKAIFIVWFVGIPLLLVYNPYYRGKTSDNLFHHDNEANIIGIIFWPPTLIVKGLIKMAICTLDHCKDFGEYLESLGKNKRGK